MAAYATPEEEWHALLSGTHPHLHERSSLRFIPSSPRCRFCKAPFHAPGALILRRYGFTPWDKNPTICARCFKGLRTASRACPVTGRDEQIGGAEIELSMLFADVRGSSKLARQMPVLEFTRLITFVKDRPGHDRRYAIDCAKLKRELDWKPAVEFAHGIELTVQWYLDNKEWSNQIRSGAYLEWIQKNYGDRR